MSEIEIEEMKEEEGDFAKRGTGEDEGRSYYELIGEGRYN